MGLQFRQQLPIYGADHERTAINKAGVNLHQTSASAQHSPCIVAIKDTTDANDRELPGRATIESPDNFATSRMDRMTRDTTIAQFCNFLRGSL